MDLICCLNVFSEYGVFTIKVIPGWTGKDGSPSPTLGTILKGSSLLATSLGSNTLNTSSWGELKLFGHLDLVIWTIGILCHPLPYVCSTPNFVWHPSPVSTVRHGNNLISLILGFSSDLVQDLVWMFSRKINAITEMNSLFSFTSLNIWQIWRNAHY